MKTDAELLRGYLDAKSEPADDGPKTSVGGKYVVVWKSQDGKWKLHVDIWNSTAA